MTPDEACLYLGISPEDEDLDIGQIERNYETKTAIYDPRRFEPGTPEYHKARRMRANIEQAYEYLTEAYYDLYGGHDDDSTPEETPPVSKKNHTNTLLKLALAMTAVTTLTLSYFLYNAKTAPKDDHDYARVLAELEQLRAKTDIPAVQGNIAPDYADLVERVMPSIVMIRTDTGTGSGFFVSSTGDILTNWHVIQDAGFITVTPQNGKSLTASL